MGAVVFVVVSVLVLALIAIGLKKRSAQRDRFRTRLAEEVGGQWCGDTLTCEVDGIRCTCTDSLGTLEISVPALDEAPALYFERGRMTNQRALTSGLPTSFVPKADILRPDDEALKVLRPSIRAKLDDFAEGSLPFLLYRWNQDSFMTTYSSRFDAGSVARAIRASVAMQQAIHAPRAEWEVRVQEESRDAEIQLATYLCAAKGLSSVEIGGLANRLAPSSPAKSAVRMIRDASDAVANDVALKIVANPSIDGKTRALALDLLRNRKLSNLDSAIREALAHGDETLINGVAEALNGEWSGARTMSIRAYVDRLSDRAPISILRALADRATEEDEARFLRIAQHYDNDVILVGVTALGKVGSVQCLPHLNEVLGSMTTGRLVKQTARDSIAKIQKRVGAVAGGLSIAEPVGAAGGLSMTESAGAAREVESASEEAESVEWG